MQRVRQFVGAAKPALAGGARYKKYDKAVLKHFYKPQNIGTLDAKNVNVGTGNHGSPACGDLARIQIEYCDETKLIKDVAFKTFGCGSAIAASSYACSLLVGRTLNQVLEVRNQQIINDLKLPPVKKHCRCVTAPLARALVANTDCPALCTACAHTHTHKHAVCSLRAASARLSSTFSRRGLSFRSRCSRSTLVCFLAQERVGHRCHISTRPHPQTS